MNIDKLLEKPASAWTDADREAVSAALLGGDKSVIPAIAVWGAGAVETVREALGGRGKVKTAAGEALLEIADQLVGDEFEEELLEMLESGKAKQEKLALEVVARLRKPPRDLAEPVADLSSQPGAGRALLRFPRESVLPELKSLITSNDMGERAVGLEIAQQYGASAAEFAPNITKILAGDTNPKTARMAITALNKILDQDALAAALSPALDHHDSGVRELATQLLQAHDIPVRASVWEGHPFSDNLLRQMQRLGFKPKGDSMRVPAERPFPADTPIDWRDGEMPTPNQLSPAVWAYLYMLDEPHDLYTVWSSYEDSKTFRFEKRNPDGCDIIGTHGVVLHLIGDGSIGMYACIDMADTSDDPAVYYTERWANWGDGHWVENRTLSNYFRSLGLRRR